MPNSRLLESVMGNLDLEEHYREGQDELVEIVVPLGLGRVNSPSIRDRFSRYTPPYLRLPNPRLSRPVSNFTDDAEESFRKQADPEYDPIYNDSAWLNNMYMS